MYNVHESYKCGKAWCHVALRLFSLPMVSSMVDQSLPVPLRICFDKKSRRASERETVRRNKTDHVMRQCICFIYVHSNGVCLTTF